MSRRDDEHAARAGSHPAERRDRAAEAEPQRLEWALARADRHSVRELHLLELAVQARDDVSAHQFELFAYEAYKDALAIKEEHGLDP